MHTRLSASTRFILAVLRLSYDILQANKEGWGKAILNILQDQYPNMKEEMAEDPQYRENPAAAIGNKLFAIARKQMQYREVDSQDPVNEFVAYISAQVDPKTKQVIKPAFDFKKPTKKGRPGAATWREALKNIYSNMRTRAISRSYKDFKAGKHTDEDLYADMLWRKNQTKNNYQWTENDKNRLEALKKTLVTQNVDVSKMVPTRLRDKNGVTPEDLYADMLWRENQAKSRQWTENDENELEALEKTLVTQKVDVNKIVPTKLRRKNVRDKSIDEAFGKRGEEGGAPEGGAARIPQENTSPGGMALDDRAAKKSFLEALDKILPDLKRELPLTDQDKLPAQRFLFNFIFEENVGTFMPDIKANMGQASEFHDYLADIAKGVGPNAKEARAILDRYGNRWSGFVGDTRKRLMNSIREFVEKYLPEDEYEQLWNEFFSDITPARIERFEEKQILESMRVQREKDLRKMLRFQEREKLNMLDGKEKADFKKLRQRVIKEINDEVAEKVKDANAKHVKNLVKFEKAKDVYLNNMMRVQHLPLEKQPRFVRPIKPVKPDPAAIRDSIPSLDEQLKAVMVVEGEDIKRGAEAEFSDEMYREEKDKTNKKVEQLLDEHFEPEIGREPTPEEVQEAQTLKENASNLVKRGDFKGAINSVMNDIGASNANPMQKKMAEMMATHLLDKPDLTAQEVNEFISSVKTSWNISSAKNSIRRASGVSLFFRRFLPDWS